MVQITALMLRSLAEGQAPLSFAITPFLNSYREEFEVNTPLRTAHFMAQLCYESQGFSRLVENLNYSAERISQVWPRLADRAQALARNPEALANAAYAGRLGNGPEASGDGWRYSGRGLIQLTFRDNYRARGIALGVDLLGSPDDAADPELACRIALSFWQSHNCNEAADDDDVGLVTRRINGGEEGIGARTALTKRAKEIFTDAQALTS